jgi:hypothetical protein
MTQLSLLVASTNNVLMASACSGMHTILLTHPLSIAAVYDPLPPSLIVKVPLDSLAESCFRAFLRSVAQFGHKLSRVKRIATVMARAIFDKGNETVCGPALGSRSTGETPREGGITGESLIKQTAKQCDELKIRSRVMATNVIRLAAVTLFEH